MIEIITAAEFRARRPKKPSKYRNKHVIVGSERFDSMAEAKRHQELLLLETAGRVMDLKRQVTFHLRVNGHKIGSVRPDWTYTETRDGQKVAEDKKGFATQAWLLRWRLAKALYPMIEWRRT